MKLASGFGEGHTSLYEVPGAGSIAEGLDDSGNAPIQGNLSLTPGSQERPSSGVAEAADVRAERWLVLVIMLRVPVYFQRV